jgi:predicted phage-related endonuclease
MEIQSMDERGAWLAARRSGIGGSDAAAVVACHPYQSLLSLYLDKTGRGKDDEDSQRLRWGRRLEGAVLDEYEFITGLEIVGQDVALPHVLAEVAPNVRMLRHATMPHAIGNLDGVVMADRGPGVVDAKTTEWWPFQGWIADGRPPLYILVQIAHYMEVAGLQWGVVAAFTGLSDPLYIYEIERDPAFGERLMEAEDTFWRRYVMRDQPPPADSSEASAKALRALYPKDNGRLARLDGPAVEWAETFDDLTERIKELEVRREQAKTLITATIGEAAVGMLPDGSGFTFKTGVRGRSLRRASAKAMRKYETNT